MSFFLEVVEVIVTVELERYVAGAYIFCVVVGKLSH